MMTLGERRKNTVGKLFLVSSESDQWHAYLFQRTIAKANK
jgi:hypothetical protein